MPPRKGPSRKPGAKRANNAQTDEEMRLGQSQEAQQKHSDDDSARTPPLPPTLDTVEAITPRHSMFGLGAKSPFIKGPALQLPPVLLSPEGRGTPRQIFTPLFGGRKYARGHIDMGRTPQQRQAVSRTPFTARRAIADYSAEKDPIRTYIRLKPAGSTQVVPRSLLQVVSDKEVEMSRGPAEDGSVAERYLFAGVLPALAQQPRVFEVCAMPVVRDLLGGYNTLLFSYGITNSGKTYTVQGTSEAPGLLPRSVKAILDVLDARGLQGDFHVRPRYATQVEYCSDPRVVAPTFRAAPGEDAWVRQLEGLGDVPEGLGEELEADGDWVYQLYVSYFEVYNEMVYDLLDLTTLTTVLVKGAKPRARQKRGRHGNKNGEDMVTMSATQIAALPRNALLLRSEGGRGEAFVDGAVEVRVRSARDLVRVLMHGQMRRSVHATGLNAGSSRSHAVFQAKLVKMPRHTTVAPSLAVEGASVRALTVVDLAGSERARRTQAAGERLAEAGKINVSLMTLKKCLDVRRFNATHDEPQLVPYNESKITRLFQPALEGGAKTIMVVCIDPCEPTDVDALDRASMAGPSLAFTETKNVLDFARVASELVTRVRRADPPPRMGALPPDAAEEEDEEEEDEIFFDTDAEDALPRKRALAVDVGVQTDDAVDAKRQRRDLGGLWQHLPAAAAADEEPARVAEPFSPRPVAASMGSVGVALSRDAAFSFAAAAAAASPLVLGSGSQQQVAALQQALATAQQQAQRQQAERATETAELVAYAEALEAGVAQVHAQWAAAQERVLRVEEETRAEVAGFFMGKMADLKRAWAERLADELARSEERAAHKIDILSRLAPATPDSDSDQPPEAATVSPRTAVRRAVSRAASKKANKVASVSAGDDKELARLRDAVDALERHAQAQATQLEMVAQARAADRHRLSTLEAALVDANERAAVAEARLMRHTAAAGPHAADPALRQHERERAELVAQVAQLKAQLRDAETLALRARRQWETLELLPVQERLRVVVAQQAAQSGSADEELERAQRDRDSAWAWWTREQERCSQLSAQNDVLMREIRHLRAAPQRPPSVEVESAEDEDDDEDGFCRVSLRSVASAADVNGEPSADVVAPSKARVLVRVPKQPSAMAVPRESMESLASQHHHAEPLPAGGGRAKRVVSRVFQHFTPEPRSAKPYMAGRFAATDTAVGSYSAEVFSYEASSEQQPPVRARGMTAESLDAGPKVRSIVYSGPIVSHATGGVSVTFTSQAVRDLPLATEHIPEEDEDELSDPHSAASASPQGTKRSRAPKPVEPLNEMSVDEEEEEEEEEPVGIESALLSAKSGGKKRRLHPAHTVVDIDASPASDSEARPPPPARHANTAPITGSWPPSASSPSLAPLSGAPPRLSSAALLPQESKNPVLFTPVRTRSRNRLPTDVSPTDVPREAESIFLTPMKMLNRLRHRKK